MSRRFAGFDWDDGNLEKCRKHGVSLAEIEQVIQDSALAVRPDPAHSRNEDRFLAVGRTAAKRAIFLVFTVRERNGARLIQPISARYMHRKEVEAFEKANPEIWE